MEQKKARTVRRRREDWLRRSGLALVLPPRVRARSLIVRTAPMMLVVFIEFVALALTWRLESSLKGRDIDDLAITDGLVSLAFVAVVLTFAGPLLGLLLAWAMRRIPRPIRAVRATFARSILADLEQGLAARDAYVVAYREDGPATQRERGDLDLPHEPE